jgi:hypothetical protein
MTVFQVYLCQRPFLSHTGRLPLHSYHFRFHSCSLPLPLSSPLPSLSYHQASTLSPAKRLSKHVSRISDTSLGISAALLERIRSSNRTFQTGQTSTEFMETILNYIINITIELQLIYRYATLNRFCLTIACSVSRI